MTVNVEIRGLKEIERYLRAAPDEAKKSLRAAVNKATEAARNEALIQISRVYTISMADAARDMDVARARGSALVAYFRTRGRPRGALNFNIRPRETSPSPAWTSKRGYSVEIIRGQIEDLPPHFFWLRGGSGNVHLFERTDHSSRGKDLEIFKTVSTPQMLQNEKVMGKVEEVTLATLEEVFARGMDRRLSKGVQ